MKPKTFSRVELGRLTHNLRLCARSEELEGYKHGKQRLRRLIQRLYDCSSRNARRLVEHLEEEGYLVAVGGRRMRGARSKNRTAHWRFRPTPSEDARWLASA